MANTFTYGAANLSNAVRTLLYTVPHTAPSSTDTTAIVHSCTVANTHGTDSVNVTIEVYDTSATYLLSSCINRSSTCRFYACARWREG